MKMFGLAHCDTVKRARAWLGERGVAHDFHDFKKQGLPEERLQAWMAAAGWQPLLNRRGTTWRQLDAAAQAAVVDADSAAAVMRAQPSVIKRPVVEWPDGRVSVGFDADDWALRSPAG